MSNKTSGKTEKEVRKGFHPVLVISTVVVVVFVLWFCPYYLMRARTQQTEARAAEILQKNSFTESHDTKEINGVLELTPVKKYSDYLFYKTTNSPILVYAIPKYYGETAKLTFCLKDGEIYKKDIDIKPAGLKLPKLDNTWQKN